ERDAVEEGLACLIVRRPRDRVAVADPDEAALLLEETGELRILDADGLDAGLQGERLGGLGPFTKLGRRARPVELRASQLEPQVREYGLGPLGGRNRNAGIERICGVDGAGEVA